MLTLHVDPDVQTPASEQIDRVSRAAPFVDEIRVDVTGVGLGIAIGLERVGVPVVRYHRQ